MSRFVRCFGCACSVGLAAWLLLSTRLHAAPMLDAQNDVGGGAAALTLRPNNFWAQSFTVGAAGLLTQIDVQVGKFEGAAGDVTFELRPIVDGLPTINDNERLYRTTLPIDEIPVINSLLDPPAFVSVDVTDLGLRVEPGEQYAISLRRSGGTPIAAWRSQPNSYADGAGYFRNLLNVPWSASIEDLGFQTWIDPTPSAPYKLRIGAAFDMQYRPGETPTLIEGETTL